MRVFLAGGLYLWDAGSGGASAFTRSSPRDPRRKSGTSDDVQDAWRCEFVLLEYDLAMPYRIHKLKGETIAHISFDGPVDAEDIESAMEDLTVEGYIAHPRRLWDFRGCRADFDLGQLQAFASMARPRDRQPGRVAILVDRELDFGQARMHQAFRESPLIEEQVFVDFEAALAWLEALDP